MVSRRKLILGGASVAVAAPLAGVAIASAGEQTPAGKQASAGLVFPRTLSRARTGLVGTSRLTAGEFAPTHLGLNWPIGAPVPAVRVRSGAGWTEFKPAAACTARGDNATTNSVVIPVGRATEYEVVAPGGRPVTVLEVNTADGPTFRTAPIRQGTAPANPSTPEQILQQFFDTRLAANLYLPRSCWGADESLRHKNADGTPDITYVSPIQTLTVHHSEIPDGTNPDEAADIRGIYQVDTDPKQDNYVDIGYQMLIGPSGKIYEGRWSGDDPLPIVGPVKDAAGRLQMVNGAHVGGWNAGNIGICMIGSFTNRLPTEAQSNALYDLLAVLCKALGLDPLATADYVNPLDANKKANIPVINSHRDWMKVGAGATDCPGNTFYPTLPAVRQAVADRLR